MQARETSESYDLKGLKIIKPFDVSECNLKLGLTLCGLSLYA